jgi:hypothetical protein
MAKDLPYFKFFCSEWNDGDVTLETFEHQGLFINICSYYWSNECNLHLDKLLKRFRGYEEIIDDLSAVKLFKINENRTISITFLDEQRDERLEQSKIKSKGGKASAESRRLKKLSAENKQNVNSSSTESQHVLNSSSTEIQLLRREEKREEDINNISFIDKIDLFKKKVGEDDNVIWRENVYRMHKIQKGKLFRVVEQFTIHLAIQNNGIYNDNFSEFRRHCSNWIGTSIQNGKLSEFRTVKAIGSI